MQVPDEVDITIVDSSDAFVFGFSKLDLMFGRKDLENVRVPYAHIDKPSVRFAQETILTIDPERRRVTTNATTYEPDILVVALGADLDPAATPGMVEEGSEFYTVEGAAHMSRILPSFEGGDVIIGVLGNFFKCPAAPFETAIMLHDYLEKRGSGRRRRSRSSAPWRHRSRFRPRLLPASWKRWANGASNGGRSRRCPPSTQPPRSPH